MQRLLRNLAATVAVALGALFATPSLLLAHTKLVRSAPAANARLTSSPSTIELWFSEPPALRMTSIDLLDSAGTRLPLGAVTGSGVRLTVTLTRVLAPGRYTVVWKTAADDGHVSDGRFFFVVDSQAAAAAPPPSAPTPTAPTPASKPDVPNTVVETTPVATLPNAIRWAEFVALFTVLGAVVFRLVILQRAGWNHGAEAEAADRGRRFGQYAVMLFLVTTLLRLSAESDLVPFGDGRMAKMMLVIRDTHWGIGWAIGGVGVVIAAVGLSIAFRGLTGWGIAAVGAIAMSVGETLTSHAASATRYQPLAVATDFVHVAAAGAWLGALALVLFAGLPSLASTGEPRAAGSRLVRSFHQSAMESVALVLLSAIVSAWLRVGSWGDFAGTLYGRVLFRKIVFAVIVLAIGAYHWRKAVVPDWDEHTARRFRRSAILELLVAAVVLGFTAVLVASALPDDAHQIAGQRAPVVTEFK
ncbi:MAG TPA: copper resistance protein CopC [Gemmatimonadaceae bacterium]|nr:copper resistance protein CopC [Gemmatimonadaceae bacterium]